jgi:hypothetical protein
MIQVDEGLCAADRRGKVKADADRSPASRQLPLDIQSARTDDVPAYLVGPTRG